MADVAHKRPISEAENILEDVKAVVIGSDGVITPRSFAKDTLLNYLRESLKLFLEQNFDSEDVQAAIEELRKQAADDSNGNVEGVVEIPGPDANQSDVVDGTVHSVVWLLNSGRKTDALRKLQSLVWCSGFKTGQILGSVYEDVVSGFERLMHDDIKIYVYTTFDVETQRLLLSFSNNGDLGDMFSGYFDTNSVGVGVEKESYTKIASNIQMNPENVLYITSLRTEVTAARAAGLKTCLMMRENDEELRDDNNCMEFAISNFAELFTDNEVPSKRTCRGDGDAVGVDDGSDGSDGKATGDDEAGDREAGDESPSE